MSEQFVDRDHETRQRRNVGALTALQHPHFLIGAVRPWSDGRYYRRIRYDQKCMPRLTPQDQTWADQQIAAYRGGPPGVLRPERCSVMVS